MGDAVGQRQYGIFVIPPVRGRRYRHQRVVEGSATRIPRSSEEAGHIPQPYDGAASRSKSTESRQFKSSFSVLCIENVTNTWPEGMELSSSLGIVLSLHRRSRIVDAIFHLFHIGLSGVFDVVFRNYDSGLQHQSLLR